MTTISVQEHPLQSLWKIIRLGLLSGVVIAASYGAALLLFDKVSGKFGNVVMLLGVLLPVVLSVRVLEKKRLPAAGLTLRPTDVLYAVLGLLLAAGLNAFILAALTLANGENYFSRVLLQIDGVRGSLLHYLLVGFSEELLFRGYLFMNTFPSLKWWQRSLLMALAFALPHLIGGDVSPVYMSVVALLYGLLFNYMAHLTGSIWMSTAFHWLWNTLVLALYAEPVIKMQAVLLVPLAVLIGGAILWAGSRLAGKAPDEPG